MFRPSEVLVVRLRFQPPLVERARVGASTGASMELQFAPAVPFMPGEEIRLLAKTDAGRFACRAQAKGSTAGGRWFQVDEWAALELRENPRVSVDIQAAFRCDGGPEIPARVRNISASGFLVESHARPWRKSVDLAVTANGVEDVFPCRTVGERKGDGDSCLTHLALDTSSVAIRARLADVFEHQLAATNLFAEKSAA